MPRYENKIFITFRILSRSEQVSLKWVLFWKIIHSQLTAEWTLICGNRNRKKKEYKLPIFAAIFLSCGMLAVRHSISVTNKGSSENPSREQGTSQMSFMSPSSCTGLSLLLTLETSDDISTQRKIELMWFSLFAVSSMENRNYLWLNNVSYRILFCLYHVFKL